MTLVSVLIPAHNESKHIFDTVRAVKQVPEADEIIVVDDASEDNTAELAEKAGAQVIRLKANIGKGGALNEGMKAVAGTIIALVDGDLGRTAGDVRKLIIPVLEGRADMTIARFPRARIKGGFGLVKGLARKGIRFYTGLEMMAPLSGQRVMTRQVFDSLGLFASGYGVEVGLTIDVARRGFRIMEVDVNMTHAETGRNIKGFIHRGKQFVHVLKVLASRAVMK